MSNLPSPGPIAVRAASEALANVGVQEQGGNNRGQWVETYLRAVGLPPGQPWCAAFARFRYENAAGDLDLKIPEHFPDSGWCPAFKEWAKKHDLWIPVKDVKAGEIAPAVGDMALFYFPLKQRVAHTGIVVKVAKTGVYTVEGNTGPDSGSEVQRDGDGVFRKWRSWNAFGQLGGFARIPF